MIGMEKSIETGVICANCHGSGKIRVFRGDWGDNDEIPCDQCSPDE
ncbi:hypothetical protein LCGC14_1008980 [marine sediment metagenome]|uniref:Uncharacterized protein n=1 Tax=marine sediment metagenome TaxID=412755 RepID=A0A0F9N0W0_9ZZZZ